MTTSPSFSSGPLYKSNNVFGAKILTSHYLYRIMDEFPDVLRLALPDYKLAK